MCRSATFCARLLGVKADVGACRCFGRPKLFVVRTIAFQQLFAFLVLGHEPARTTHRAIWDHRHHTNLVRIASLLRADMIFGNDRPLERFLSERNFRPRVKREVFRPKSRVSPRRVTAGQTLERRHCVPGLRQHRVEVTAVSALPSDLHRQLDDRRGDLRQCLNALGPEFRFGHGGLSRFGFERCHGSSGAVRTVCVLAGAALVQSPVVRA